MTTLQVLAAGMRAAAARGRTVVPVDGFALYLAPESAAPHLSLAIPAEVAPADWRAALAALPAAFAAHDRQPRIEAFVEPHPGLAEAAASLGWRTAMTAPVMLLTADRLTPAPVSGAEYRPFDPADDARLTAALRGAHLAFGGAEDDPEALTWRPRLLRGMETGAILGGAVDVDGVPRAGAALQRGGDVAELAGVWTHPSYRRRGLARAACHALLLAGFAAGVTTVWLSAAEGALTLYERLGFARVGTQVNLEAP